MKKSLLMLILISSCLCLISCGKQETKICHLSFLPNGGTLEQTQLDVPFGTHIELPIPTKENKTFTRWRGSHGIVLDAKNYLVTSDEAFTAIYDSFDITYLDRSGSVAEVRTFKEGEAYLPNSTRLADEVTSEAYYLFKGWNEEQIKSTIEEDYVVSSLWEADNYLKTTFYLESWLVGDNDYEFDLYFRDHLISDKLVDNFETIYLAFSLAFASTYYSDINKIYHDLAFDDLYYAPDYFSASTKESESFSFAHKRLSSGIDLINVTMQGSYPTIEWANNFDIGAEGQFSGYLKHARRIKEALTSYLAKYENSNVRLLINGYSRGGGIAQVLSYLLDSDEEFLIKADQRLTLTFEAPRPVDFISRDVENCINYFMAGDIVASVAPSAYGLYHYGIEKPIYDDASIYIGVVDPNITIPKFNPNEGLYQTQAEYLDYIWSVATSNEYDEDIGLSSRNAFYIYTQELITYFLEIFVDSSYSTYNKLLNKFSNMSINDLKKTVTDAALLKEAVYPILASDSNLSINEAELTAYLSQLAKIMKDGPGMRLIMMFYLNSNNIKRSVIYHYPEIVFSYLYSQYLTETPYIQK